MELCLKQNDDPVAADLGISEFTLREVCKRLQIPTPPRGHFNHKNPRERMQRPSPDESASQNADPPGDRLSRR
jgi:hypothetical protein